MTTNRAGGSEQFEMPSGNQKRTRIQRVAALEMPPSPLERIVASFQREEVLWRIGLCMAVALALWVVVRGWGPPFAYWRGYIPPGTIFGQATLQPKDDEWT